MRFLVLGRRSEPHGPGAGSLALIIEAFRARRELGVRTPGPALLLALCIVVVLGLSNNLNNGGQQAVWPLQEVGQRCPT